MSELKRCPFCDIPLKLVGSKQRGNQHYLHEYNSNCILNGFGFIATDENIEHWNNRKPLERIVERLKNELLESINKANDEMIDNGHTLDFEHYFGEKESYENAIEIVKEEGGMNEIM